MSTALTITWQDYHTYIHRNGNGSLGDHSVVGNVVVRDVASPQLQNSRDIFVYLPPSYLTSNRRYPVLYMHDGQNLFDQASSYAGEWGVDETMERLGHEEHLEAIVVGIPNQGRHRVDEYSPYHDPYLGGGRGDRYLDYLVHTLKPRIDRDFRTLPGRQQTGLMGSSMGGLITLYAFFRHSDVFGFAGAMSPSLWFAQGAIFETVEAAAYHPGKIYLDAGTRELGSHPYSRTPHAGSRRYYSNVRRMKRILVRKGYRPVYDLLHVEEKWANHSEASWARRLPVALRFFLTEAYRQ
jgi:predicted alpha/beta superfamily hydrolase